MRNAVQENISLAPLTTLGVGGRARYLVEVAGDDEVPAAIDFARARSLPILVLGGGSNLLVSDAGFSGVVVRVVSEGVVREGACVRARAGVDWDEMVSECVASGLYGVECLSGIPGRVGGTPIQNVGAYGQEVSDVISRVRVYDMERDALRDLTAGECRFGYRSSLFNGEGRGRFVVLEVEYLLKRQGEPCLTYPDLAGAFRACAAPPGLPEVRDEVLRIRRDKAMLRVKGDPDCRSAGSFFRNPRLTDDEFARLERRAGGVAIPAYRVDDRGGGVKVPAAWLVEQSGFPKGTTDGPVGLSAKHALAVINRGGASAADVVRFAGRIREAVEARFGVRLGSEPAFVGFSEEVVADFGAVVA